MNKTKSTKQYVVATKPIESGNLDDGLGICFVKATNSDTAYNKVKRDMIKSENEFRDKEDKLTQDNFDEEFEIFVFGEMKDVYTL